MHRDARERIDALTRAQLGLVTRTQLIEAGLSSAAISRHCAWGELERLAPHVYRSRGGPADSDHQHLLALCLSIGNGTIASHRSAAWLWQLDGFQKLPFKHELSVPHGQLRPRKGVTVHQRREALKEGFVIRDGVPATTLERTLLDLATFLDLVKLEVALDSAARQRRGPFFEELDEFLSALKPQGRDGFWKLYDLVQLRRGGEHTGSTVETLVLAELRRAGIEAPVLQHPVFVTDERPLCHVDFAWPRKKIALFADSGYHVGKRARLDAHQRLTLSKLGWTCAVVFKKMLDDRTWIRSFAELFHPKLNP